LESGRRAFGEEFANGALELAGEAEVAVDPGVEGVEIGAIQRAAGGAFLKALFLRGGREARVQRLLVELVTRRVQDQGCFEQGPGEQEG
jgi:hypothetical protein